MCTSCHPKSSLLPFILPAWKVGRHKPQDPPPPLVTALSTFSTNSGLVGGAPPYADVGKAEVISSQISLLSFCQTLVARMASLLSRCSSILLKSLLLRASCPEEGSNHRPFSGGAQQIKQKVRRAARRDLLGHWFPKGPG